MATRRAWVLLSIKMAIFAIFFAALAPNVSVLLGGSGQAGLLFVCSADSPGIAGDSEHHSGRGSGDLAGLDHCPYCVLQHHAVAVMPSVPVLMLGARVTGGPPEVEADSPRLREQAVPPQSRGPPTVA